MEVKFYDGRDKEIASISVNVVAADTQANIAVKVANAIQATGKFAAGATGNTLAIRAGQNGHGWDRMTYWMYDAAGNVDLTLDGPTLKDKKLVTCQGSQIKIP